MKLMSWRPSEYSHRAGHCARLLHQVGTSLSPSRGYPTKKIAWGLAPANRPPSTAAKRTTTMTTTTAIAIHNVLRFGVAGLGYADGSGCSSIRTQGDMVGGGCKGSG